MSRMYLDTGESFMPRRYTCEVHGTHDSPRCPICAKLDDATEAIRECLHIHSKRIDQQVDLAMILEARISDLAEVVNSLVRRVNARERLETQRHEAEQAPQNVITIELDGLVVAEAVLHDISERLRS